ncbi:hypothetical protein EYZ11_007844 [Aspergillus tanneri]|uniref:Uncharacterized protein n=1 Tax=Aspergillus tanneri TaxID=1220188 RepID=A0A4S3JBY5_9EURO|nr:hypothetical protein EYZ11_007844 [Aspergillus tanneri]
MNPQSPTLHTGPFEISASRAYINSIVTQTVDSFHSIAHPQASVLVLHGYLRSEVYTSCRNQFSRAQFQQSLKKLNLAWAEFLAKIVDIGALDTNNPEEQR